MTCPPLELLLFAIQQFLAINGFSCDVCELEGSVMDEFEDANYKKKKDFMLPYGHCRN